MKKTKGIKRCLSSRDLEQLERFENSFDSLVSQTIKCSVSIDNPNPLHSNSNSNSNSHSNSNSSCSKSASITTTEKEQDSEDFFFDCEASESGLQEKKGYITGVFLGLFLKDATVVKSSDVEIEVQANKKPFKVTPDCASRNVEEVETFTPTHSPTLTLTPTLTITPSPSPNPTHQVRRVKRQKTPQGSPNIEPKQVIPKFPTTTSEEDESMLRKKRLELLAKYPSLGGINSSLVSDNSAYHLPKNVADIERERLAEARSDPYKKQNTELGNWKSRNV